MTTTKITTFEAAQDALAASLPGYERRAPQATLAHAIEAHLAHTAPHEHLLGEAGTGTGKSLGYLIPAILSGKRVIISTATKALQDQLCVAPDTKILTADLRHVPASEIVVGQNLVGFDEERDGTRRRYRNSIVESVERIERPCYEIEFDDGTNVVCSSEHRWLCGHTMETKWMTTEQLCPTAGKRPGSKVIRLSSVWENDSSWESGYLAGLFDGEGCLQQRKVEGGHFNSLTFSQNNNSVLKTGLSILDGCGIGYSIANRAATKESHQDCNVVRISQRSNIMRVLGQFRPHRLLEKFDPEMLGTIPGRKGGAVNGQRVVRKTFLGNREVLAIRTSTRTYIAEGLASHNCNSDLPFLQEHLGVKFTFAVLKGRSNYYCHVAGDKVALDNPPLMQLVNRTLDAHKDDETFLAERDDFDGIESRDFSALTTSADDCPGKKKCPFGDTCFAERAKKFAKDADIVVVNHALLLTHLRIARSTQGLIRILGDFDTVIFDEAHEIEEYATSAWQIDLREKSLINFATDVRNFAFKVGVENNPTAQRLSEVAGPLTAAIQKLWQVLPEGRLLITDISTIGNTIIDLYEVLVDVATLIRDTDTSKVAESEKKARQGNQEKLQKRCGNLIEALGGLIARPEDFNDLVRWVDTEALGRRGVTNKVLHSAPVNVAPLLRDNLFGQNRACFACEGAAYGCKSCGGSGKEQNVTCILVSATLSVARKFDYVSGRLGVDSYDGLDVGTPFDYPEQSRLYIPSHLPEPTQANREAHASMAITEIKALVKASNGRALLLFTSNAAMKRAYEALKGEIDHTVLVQGQDSNKVLAAKFMEDVSSVLFATRSFFTGVDFQGEACSLVVIDKLVFDVPTDPIFAARCEAVERAGGKSFFDYSIPKMALTLKQGHGRLIRHRGDRGIVAILDPRVITKGYGKTVLSSLPDSPVINSLKEVREFYSEIGGE